MRAAHFGVGRIVVSAESRNCINGNGNSNGDCITNNIETMLAPQAIISVDSFGRRAICTSRTFKQLPSPSNSQTIIEPPLASHQKYANRISLMSLVRYLWRHLCCTWRTSSRIINRFNRECNSSSRELRYVHSVCVCEGEGE